MTPCTVVTGSKILILEKFKENSYSQYKNVSEYKLSTVVICNFV